MNFNKKNHAFRWLVALLMTLAMPAASSAKDDMLALESVLRADAVVLKGTREGFWEKTLVVSFPESRRVLSTRDGFINARAIVNHSAHSQLWGSACRASKTQGETGGKAYLRQIGEKVAGKLRIKKEEVTELGTAADMDHLALVTKAHPPFVVTALVTAGAKSNALRTGLDEGVHIEGEEPKGTVIVFILTNAGLTDGAMAGALITVTEAKTAAFQDLDVPSAYTKSAQATGTGTDGIVIVTGEAGPKVTYTGGHSKIGELIGKAAREAVIEALGKQNGFKLKK